ncbi:MAG: hypothetical protein JRE57_00145 [Deltaproteobacteria bacterium]|nr:hypothetical protein [Deltaproteobacteria bacterium]
MNLISFLDELIKIGGVAGVVKQADDVSTVDIPHGMIDEDPPPDSIKVYPHEASSRLPLTAKTPSAVQTGHLGDMTQAKDPIDRNKHNRGYRDRG